VSDVEVSRGSLVDHSRQVDQLWRIIRDLREMAGALELVANALPAEVTVTPSYFPVVNFTCYDAPTMARAVKWVGGGAKRSTDFLMHVEHTYGSLSVDVKGDRENVCRKVKVGTETVEVPDPAAPPVTVERDVYEWECHPILGSLADA